MQALTEEQSLIGRSLERFLREHYSLAQRAKALASGVGFGREHWSMFADLGLLGLPFSLEDGGHGGSLADVMSIMQQFGGSLVVEPYLACVVTAGRLLALSGDAERRRGLLEQLAKGTYLLGLAHWEHGGRFDGRVSHTKLRHDGGRFLLSGHKTLVPAAAALDAILITARDDAGALCICLVPTRYAGLSVRGYRTVDGQTAGDVWMADVRIETDAILSFSDSDAALRDVLTYTTAALCAEALGSMRALLEMTIGYAKTRTQFGRTLASFQVLKHRLVDCHIQCEQAASMVEIASVSSAASWSGNVAAAKALISEASRALGHEAIQIHGGMGLTDELAVSHHHKRLTMISMLFGDASVHADSFISASDFSDPRHESTALPFDALLSAEDRRFRLDTRSFLNRALTPRLRQAVRLQTTPYPEKHVMEEWQDCLRQADRLPLRWPSDGGDWTALQRFIFEYECAVAGAPEPVPMGFRYVGPVIARFGTPWQQAHFLPKLLSGEHYWAQGFSEPGAGSDLAALKTTAELRGDHYVLNGTKMWTTHAHVANWIFCIARTARSNKAQDGISFFLIEMKSPGMSVRPIRMLAIDHEVNQVFLDNVSVPRSHLVGEEGRGWEYTKFLLDQERGGSTYSGRLRHDLNLVKELIGVSEENLWNDRVFAHRLAFLEFRLMALERSEFMFAAATRDGASPGPQGSAFKLVASELQKDVTEIAIHAAGFSGLVFSERRPLAGLAADAYGSELAQMVMPRYLNMRVASIFGGTSEIQREIIAKRVLELN